MPNTDKMKWPYPDKDTDPWFEKFASMTEAMDASGYAAREDRNTLISNGGIFSFTASTGLLSWSSALSFLSPIDPFKQSIPAASVTILDGQRLYVNIARAPQSNSLLTAIVANQTPNENDATVICIRDGSSVYFRNGSRISDGESKSIFSGSSSGAKQVDVIKIATRETHNSVVPLIVGGFSFNPSDYDKPGFTKVMAFRAVASNGNTSMTTSVKLRNVTDSDDIATLSFTSTAFAKDQVILVEGLSAGQVDSVEKIYEVRILLSVPPSGPLDTIELAGAEIVITSTAI
jgi:hypothetical protein